MNSFDDNYETVHKKVFSAVSEGFHSYFIKCRDFDDPNDASTETEELEIFFRLDSPIQAQIVFDDEEILGEGKHEFSLSTSKVPNGVPQLSYTFNGISYTPIVLEGSGTSWQGKIAIEPGEGEKVGSFKFEAKDLEGRTGTRIKSGSTFEVDTKEPGIVTNLEATGSKGEIELTWELPESVDKVNIYRSETEGVTYNDFYKSIDGSDDDYELNQ